jgi:CPA1 family monovalent cation:H+ antiporter
MDAVLAGTVSLLVIAILVAIVAKRVSLPYTVGLVATGIGIAFLHVDFALTLTHDFIFDVILPPLLFEAALSLHWRDLQRDMLPIMTLSILGVIISAAVVAAGLTYLLGWPLISALMFGVLIAATDPVAVIAMFKDTGVKGRLRLLVESESLFNDGVAAVFFGLVLTLANSSGASVGPAQIAMSMALISGGGIAVGLLCGAAAALLAGRTNDQLAETAMTTAAAYGSFLIAEHFHVSGVLATVAAGLLMGNIAVHDGAKLKVLSEQARSFVVAFWDFAAFIANSFVFLMIGIATASISFNTLGAVSLTVAIVLVLTGRLLTVYPICFVFCRSRWAIPAAQQLVLWWGGLRGALALALSLALSKSFPHHDEILIATFGVVTFSVVAQGMTMKPLLRLLNLL